ncbi:MAG: hypothetical protein OEV91_03140 [Desulfobulbaceae bacterium]|nr:hypothetical protein [Desulfobulbaceae bacterium]
MLNMAESRGGGKYIFFGTTLAEEGRVDAGQTDKDDFLHDELLLIRDSGEIPEVAYHSALYYLTEDPEGPGLRLEEADYVRLKSQVVARYRWIILRDLDPANRDLRLYRGVDRCRQNWQRLCQFCRRQELTMEPIRQEAADALLLFLRQEVADVATGHPSSVNCCVATLGELAGELGLAEEDLPPGWRQICPETASRAAAIAGPVCSGSGR